MSFRKQETENYLLCDTPVENLFISEYAKEAPGDYVKVYLLALMYANLGKDCSCEQLAGALSVSLRQIDDAWDYWNERGLVEIRTRGNERDIEFVSLKEKLFSKAPSGSRKASSAKKLDNRELSELFRSIEEETGRLLESKEPEAVAVWLDEFGLKPEVILLGYRYTVKNGRSTRYRYVEKILMDWRERGLDTKEKVEEFLSDIDRKYDRYRKVFKALGFRRNPTEAEMDVMDSWFDDMGMSLEDALDACKKTSGISNPSINYINSIMVSKAARAESDSAEENARLIKAVDDRYHRLREENARKAEKIREKIYFDIPELGDVMDELKSLGISISRCILKGSAGKAELEESKKRQKELLEKKTALLEENGYRKDALDPIYSCSKCSDTGVLEDGTRCSCYFDRLTEVKNEQRKTR